MATIIVTKSEVDAIFDNSKHQSDYVIGLHKHCLEKAGIEFKQVQKESNV